MKLVSAAKKKFIRARVTDEFKDRFDSALAQTGIKESDFLRHKAQQLIDRRAKK